MTRKPTYKELLLDAIRATGDRPEDVICYYFDPPIPDFIPRNPGDPGFQKECAVENLPHDDSHILSAFCHSRNWVYTLDTEKREVKVRRRTDT